MFIPVIFLLWLLMKCEKTKIFLSIGRWQIKGKTTITFLRKLMGHHLPLNSLSVPWHWPYKSLISTGGMDTILPKDILIWCFDDGVVEQCLLRQSKISHIFSHGLQSADFECHKIWFTLILVKPFSDPSYPMDSPPSLCFSTICYEPFKTKHCSHPGYSMWQDNKRVIQKQTNNQNKTLLFDHNNYANMEPKTTLL